MPSAVQLVGVTKRYGTFTAVSDLSLDIPAGSIYGLLGPNGAGKTTTIRMINDILAPDAGTIRLLGDLAPGQAAAQRIGYLPEERGLYPRMSVLDTLGFFGQLKGLGRRDAARRAAAWLDRLSLGEWAAHKVQDLSKGMQQKVQFITAVIHEPDLMILDEPWSGLDPLNADVLLDIVKEQKKAGRTILFSTHVMEQAERMCDEVCIISRARKILDGPVPALKRAAASDRTVAVAFSGEADARRAAPALADARLVMTTHEQPGHLEVELATGVAAQALLARLVADEVGLRRFQVIEATLHQIFVEHVRAAEAAHV